jgi:glycosyltransferase involved in cell wall biosynthesis
MSEIETPAPLVSFIVASYNYGRHIGRTLQSILDQTEQDFEIVVVDDGSTDNSLDVIRSFGDPRVRLHVNDSNLGSVPTYNRGTSLARGDFLTYLDSDDWIEPRKAEEQVAYFRRHPEVEVVGTHVNFYDDDGVHARNGELQEWFNRQYDYTSLETWVGDNTVAGCSVMLTRGFHGRYGLRDPDFGVCADFELWTRAFANGCRFGTVPLPLMNYRLHEDSLSQRNAVVTFLEISYLLHKNILPQINAAPAPDLARKLIEWHLAQPSFQSLNEDQRGRLLAALMDTSAVQSCGAYKLACLGPTVNHS